MTAVPCRTLLTDGLEVRFCPDAPAAAADRLRAVLRGRFFDELTGRGLTGALTLRGEPAGFTARAAGDGLAGLVGVPRRRLPDLSAAAVQVALRVQAEGYLPRQVRASLGPFTTVLGFPADWPDYFEPADVGDVAMHRAALTLAGRVVRADVIPSQPAAGATVSIGAIWRRFPAMHEVAGDLVEPGEVLSLRPGLYRERSAAGATLTALPLAAAGGEAKRLTAGVRAGDDRVPLSDRINLNLAGGDLLGIEPAHPDLAEVIPILGVVASASSPDQPSVVRLAHPLALDHVAGAPAVRQIVQPGVPSANALRHDAIPGDCLVFLDGLVDVGLAPDTVAIDGGGAGLEVQTASRLRTLTDAGGWYRLPALARIAQLSIQAAGGGLVQPIERLVSPRYGLTENRFDLVST